MPRRTAPLPPLLRLLVALVIVGTPIFAAIVDGAPRKSPRRRSFTPDQMQRLRAADDGLRILTRNARLSETYISPKGDGVQDVTLISYEVVAPDSITMFVYLDTAAWGTVEHPFRGIIRDYELRPPGPTVIPFNGNIGTGPDAARLDGVYGVIIRAIGDTGRVEVDTLMLVIDRVSPVLQSVTTLGGLSSYRNGETVVIQIQADQPGYTASANFSGIDSDPINRTEVLELGNGRYEIRHVISDTNTKADTSNVLVPVRLVDLAGNFTNYNALRLCLSNHPPVLLSAVTLNAPEGAYKGESLIQIETTWQSVDTALTVRADFKGIDTAYDSTRYVTSRLPGNRYHSTYRLSDANQKPDGSYLVPIVASDHGCGVSPAALVTIALDTEAPPLPVFDAVPTGVREPAYTLRGTANGSVRVLVLQNEALVDTFQVNPDGRFEVPVTLVPGNNRFTAEGLDTAGNKTVRSVPVQIVYVTGGYVTIPLPFRPGNTFQVGASQPASGVRIELWTLGGDLARVLTNESPAEVYNISWDGRDEAGERLNSGPLIAIITTDFTDGSSATEKRAMVLASGAGTP
ncbi:MAG TPA: hypothetical protein VF720_00220 [Candidatus Eisenbacteria bacterium]